MKLIYISGEHRALCMQYRFSRQVHPIYRPLPWSKRFLSSEDRPKPVKASSLEALHCLGGCQNSGGAMDHTARSCYMNRGGSRTNGSCFWSPVEEDVQLKSAEPHNIFDWCSAFMRATDQRLKVGLKGWGTLPCDSTTVHILTATALCSHSENTGYECLQGGEKVLRELHMLHKFSELWIECNSKFQRSHTFQ